MSHPLPIPDQRHLNRVRDALWSRQNAGASVMIGSGFSRNADKLRTGAGAPPLWNDITAEIVRTLFPGLNDPPPNSALSLAQKYKDDFGRSELHRLLSELVKNDDFVPGETHLRLLKLPWRDVFTTNWDTLLERASAEIAEPSYSVVQDKDQFPLLSQPRIIKLHGSLPAQFPLVITEEDYQEYQTEYAPFVNTVQQAMMESVFCLIGFSGDDPNFLNWSKWVYDNLGEASPKIYLAGFLRLSPEKRHELESRNVVPIDVGNHPRSHTWPEHRQHEYATQWILQTLEEGEPYDRSNWPVPPEIKNSEPFEYLEPVQRMSFDIPKSHSIPGMERNQASYTEHELDRVKEVLTIWAYNRALYPGWLVFPSESGRPEFSRQTEAWDPHILGILPSLEPIERLNAIRELVWRREISLEPFTPDLEAAAQNALDAIDCNKRVITGSNSSTANWAEVRESWRAVAGPLITCARLDCDQPKFERRLEQLAPFRDDSPDVAHRMNQERCLWALYSSDFPRFNDALTDWQVEKSEPVWMLRKAALLSEARRHDESKGLIQMSLNLARKHFADERSIANASILSWALGSTLTLQNWRSIERRWDEFASLKCDIQNETDHIRRVLSGTSEREDPPTFDLALSRTTRIEGSRQSYTRVVAAYRAVRLPEVTGLPISTSPQEATHTPMSMVSDILTQAADELTGHAPELAIRLALRICRYDRDKTLQRALSRNVLATLPIEEIERLARISIEAVEYLLPRLFVPEERGLGISSIERMRVFLEALSRLVLRLAPESVSTAMDLALRCYKDDRVVAHIWLAKPLGNLLERSWEALPKHLRQDHVFDLLTAPIVGMNGFIASEQCPDPSTLVRTEDLPTECDPAYETQYRETVKLLVQGIQSDNDDARSVSMRRLWSLAIAEKLTEDERSEVAAILWTDSDPILNNTPGPRSPLDWIFIVLPELVPGQAETSFRSKWLTKTSKSLDTEDALSFEALQQLGAAISSLQSLSQPFAISDLESGHVADYISAVLRKYSADSSAYNSGDTESIRQLGTIGSAISLSEQVADEIFGKVKALIETENVHPGSSLNQFLSPGFELRGYLAFGLIPCLAKALPGRLETIERWLTTALASGDDVRVRRAMTTVRRWISMEDSLAQPHVPDNVIREIGAIVASRRRDALADALWCAASVVDKGSSHQRDAISLFVLHGLGYLVEELQYGRYQTLGDVPTMRLLCVQIAGSMARHGYKGHSAIEMWLQIGRDDPFPEIRAEVAFVCSEQPSETGKHNEDTR